VTEALHAEERTLLTRLGEKESEASGYRINLNNLEEEVDSIRTELNGIRRELLDNFLFDNLGPKLITYTINFSTLGEITLALAPIAGGELEFDRLKSQLGWPNMGTVPLFYILAYLRKGTPWTTTDLTAYAT
jgi:hypothetical protein